MHYQTDVFHINSYRKKLYGKSPYEAFYFYYGKDLADKLGCHEVAASSINLTESSKSPTSNAKSIKWWVGTYLCQVEYKLHLTSSNSCYSVMSK
nr:hypothetical protein [Lacrimispora celerecrescens]